MHVVVRVHAPRRGVEAAQRELLSKDDFHPSVSSESSSSPGLGRLKQLLDFPQRERDEELLLFLRETERVLALLAAERANEAYVENERRLNLGRRRWRSISRGR